MRTHHHPDALKEAKKKKKKYLWVGCEISSHLRFSFTHREGFSFAAELGSWIKSGL
jgi:hypothetical protein